MADITPDSTLLRRLSHGKISRSLCLEAEECIRELLKIVYALPCDNMSCGMADIVCNNCAARARAAVLEGTNEA